LLLGDFPDSPHNKSITAEYSEWLGMMAAEGYINNHYIQFSNVDKKIQEKFIDLTNKCFVNAKCILEVGTSGFGDETRSERIRVSGLSKNEKSSLREMLYEPYLKHKRVPAIILNASKERQLDFIHGYYAGDGLKKDKCVYEFKSYKTNSPLLAQGILFLIQQTTKQSYNINTFIQNRKVYNQVDLHSDHNPNNFGAHLRKDQSILKKKTDIKELVNDGEFVFNIETGSGHVMAGIGKVIVSNSPGKRGPNFVTRKISLAVANIIYGNQTKLYLGNLDAKRDWGIASDFVEGFFKILEHNEPDDFVLATGETHSVREFCQIAFEYAKLGDYEKYVSIDPRFYRPAEVDVLIGDASKAKRVLGWKPQTRFESLVKQMVDFDIQLVGSGKAPSS
jgi:GDPmannose 4,6-dehydratase